MRPVYGVCGYQYQEGPPPSAASALCGCGMFAVGMCTDCASWQCGVHGGIRDDGRFRCGACEERRIAAINAENQQRQAREEAEGSKRLAAWAATIAEYHNLPKMTGSDWVEFLLGNDKWGAHALEPDTYKPANQLPVYRGKRPADLSIQEAIAVFVAAKFPTRRVEVNVPFRTGQTFSKTAKVQGWIVGTGTGTTTRYEDQVEIWAYWAVLGTGKVMAADRYIGRKDFRTSMYVLHGGWSATPENMANARRWLKAPQPVKKATWAP